MSSFKQWKLLLRDVVCYIRLQASNLWSLLYMRSEEQPNELPKGAPFKKFNVCVCWTSLQVDAEMTITPDYEFWGCCYVCFKTYLTCDSHRIPAVPWQLKPEGKVFVGVLTSKPKSFSEPLPRLWHSLPSAWEPLLQRAAWWWLDSINLSHHAPKSICSSLRKLLVMRGLSQRKCRNHKERRGKAGN